MKRVNGMKLRPSHTLIQIHEAETVFGHLLYESFDLARVVEQRFSGSSICCVFLCP